MFDKLIKDMLVDPFKTPPPSPTKGMSVVPYAPPNTKGIYDRCVRACDVQDRANLKAIAKAQKRPKQKVSCYAPRKTAALSYTPILKN